MKNEDLLNEFDTVAGWMIKDTEAALFKGGAQILAAQGLMNYIETIGSFILPNRTEGERFDRFFSMMGTKYQELLKRFSKRRNSRPHVIYDDLRCGLTHEYAVKRKKFVVLKYGGSEPSDNNLNSMFFHIKDHLNQIHRIECDCGVIHRWDYKKGVWYIVVPKLWLDFRNALQKYQKDVRDLNKEDLRNNFFKRAREINLVEILKE